MKKLKKSKTVAHSKKKVVKKKVVKRIVSKKKPVAKVDNKKIDELMAELDKI